MRSKTWSFKGLNGTLMRNDLMRFGPLWGIYGLVWLFMMPFQQFLELFGNGARYLDYPELLDLAQRNVGYAGELGLPMAVIFGCLFAMALYSYLDNARSVGMMHSFPIRRSGLFFSHYLTGCGVFLGTLAVCGLLTAAIQGAAGVLLWSSLGGWFLCTAGEMLFFYSFAVFCAMFTGQLLAVPVFYGIWNGLVFLVTCMIQNLAHTFLYGYQNFGLPGWVIWLTPVMKISEQVGVQIQRDPKTEILTEVSWNGLGVLGIYALAAVILAALAYGIYRFRPSETAGDTVSVGWAKQLFRLGVGFTAALTLGQGLYILVWGELFMTSETQQSLGVLVVCMVLTGLVGFYGAEMLLQKSFRVLKSGWKGAAVTVSLVLILCIAVGMDFFSVETRVPEADRVESVAVSIYGGRGADVTLQDPRQIQRVEAIHRQALDQREEQELRQADQYGDQEPLYETGSLTIRYQLKNGNSLARHYQLSYQDTELQDPETLAGAITALFAEPEVQETYLLNGTGLETLEEMMEALDGGHLTYPSSIYLHGWDSQLMPFPRDAAQKILAAVVRDLEAGRGGNPLSGNWEQTYVNELVFQYEQPRSQQDWFWNAEDFSREFHLEFTPAYTETIAVLKDCGIVTEKCPLVTSGEMDRLTAESPEEVPATTEQVPSNGETTAAVTGVVVATEALG